MNALTLLLKIIQAGAVLAPLVQELRDKDSEQAEQIGRLLGATVDAVQRGREGAAYLQTLSGELEQLHAQGRSINEADINRVLGDIDDAAEEIEAERKKLDAPSQPE